MFEHACEAVMAIMKGQRCTTEVALETLIKSEEKQAQIFMGWLKKMQNGNGNKMHTLKEITLSCYVCMKDNCDHKKYTVSISSHRFPCVCVGGKRHSNWQLRA